MEIAKGVSLAKLCHVSMPEGICAISYAEEFAAEKPDCAAWGQLRDVLAQRMNMFGAQITSLPELVRHLRALAQAIRNAKASGLSTACLEEVVLAARDPTD